MKEIYKAITQNFQFTGNIEEDSINLLLQNNKPEIAGHVKNVGMNALEFEAVYEINTEEKIK